MVLHLQTQCEIFSTVFLCWKRRWLQLGRLKNDESSDVFYGLYYTIRMKTYLSVGFCTDDKLWEQIIFMLSIYFSLKFKMFIYFNIHLNSSVWYILHLPIFESYYLVMSEFILLHISFSDIMVFIYDMVCL